MKRALGIGIIFGTLLAGFAAYLHVQQLLNEHVVRQSPALLSRFGGAHACPVAGQLLTAAHVSSNDDGSPSYYVIQTNDGEVGAADGTGVDQRIDAGVLSSSIEVGQYPLASQAAVGDAVYWTEFNFRVSQAYQPVEREAKIVTIWAGHIFYDYPPASGASGGCLFNSAGEVIGIVIASDDMIDGQIGIAVSIIGLF